MGVNWPILSSNQKDSTSTSHAGSPSSTFYYQYNRLAITKHKCMSQSWMKVFRETKRHICYFFFANYLYTEWTQGHLFVSFAFLLLCVTAACLLVNTFCTQKDGFPIYYPLFNDKSPPRTRRNGIYFSLLQNLHFNAPRHSECQWLSTKKLHLSPSQRKTINYVSTRVSFIEQTVDFRKYNKCLANKKY